MDLFGPEVVGLAVAAVAAAAEAAVGVVVVVLGAALPAPRNELQQKSYFHPTRYEVGYFNELWYY